MSNLFNLILYQPLFNGLIILYNSIAFRDLGAAIIILTIIIRLILAPFFHRSLKQQKALQSLTPHIKKIQEEHKNNKEKQTQAMLELYRAHGVNPLSSIYLLLIQFPILYALYRVFLNGLNNKEFSLLYSFVSRPTVLDHSLFGLMNLQSPSVFIAILAAAAQYFQGLLAVPKAHPGEKLGQAEMMAKNMAIFMAGFTFIILFRFPSALGLYWLTTALFSLAQQIIVNRASVAEVKN
ncbi:MAG TPA: YidC/Oxa1 family membrane protein insertase [Candidatus Tyrphobacter sp.]|nr:YidC/Oxa1 family membrane protein insertase [Candidatus Tyrphobacter sp.]